MSGSQYNYIRVPTAYNNSGFEANDLQDYGEYNGSLQRSLSGFSDDTRSFGSPTYEGSPTYAVSPSLDSFDYKFDPPYYGHRQVPAPKVTATATSEPYTAHWTDTPSLRHKNTLNSQQAVTGSLGMQPSTVMSTPSPEYVCLQNGCRQKAFRRSADLDRHIKHVHLKPPDVYFCDYNRCPRSEKAVAATTSQPLEAVSSPSSSSSGAGAGTGAFGRKDHCRAHYRDYHREDLCRRNGKEAAGWFDERNISSSWWRCTKCLRKVSYSRCGWECRDCGQMLEPERISARKRRIGKNSSSSSSRGY